MGKMSRKMDPLVAVPRNVRDLSGRVQGFYFSNSSKLRMLDGQTVAVDADGRFRINGVEQIVDLTDFTLKQ